MLDLYIKAKHYLTNLMLIKQIKINNLEFELDYKYRFIPGTKEHIKHCKELSKILRVYKKELKEIKNNLKIVKNNIVVVVNSNDIVTAVYDTYENSKNFLIKANEHSYSQIIQQVPKVGEMFIPNFVLQPWLKKNPKYDNYKVVEKEN